MSRAAEGGETGRKRDEGSLLRRRRISRPPGLGRLTGIRTMPGSLAGGALGLLVLIIFFASLSGNPLKFLFQVGLLVGVTALAIWAVVASPIRPTFDQRWRPHRRIVPLDTEGWSDLAASLGAIVTTVGRPCMRGSHDGTAFKLEFRRIGGARTMAGAVLPGGVRRKLVIYPRRANFHTRLDRETGDAAFDRDWRVVTADLRLVRRFVHPAARRWIEAVEPERVVVRGSTVTAWCPAFVSDPDQLRGLIELVVAAAQGDRHDGDVEA